jgi:geranylgeranyl diphosphate synthase type I
VKDDFKQRLGEYKQVIDADIDTYAVHVRHVTQQQYGAYAGVVTDAYLDMLGRGGKRIRGALAMAGYEMCGGTDRDMIVRAATALEMMHAYILIIDDIQDRSAMRRGKPTVHAMLAAYHREQGLKGDAAHTGISLALNAALSGAHAAQMLFAGLSVDPELRLKVLGIVNRTMAITAHGQTTDIMNELAPSVTSEDVERALEWKTAHYSILNPLCVGMVLAGAGCEDTDAIRSYALHTGRAFQITDDIMGVFGDEAQTGKGDMDDIREGKQTILTIFALEQTSHADRTFLKKCLGNASLTRPDFERARDIIRTSGALSFATNEAQGSAHKAVQALQHQEHRWSKGGVSFLRELAEALLARTQ